MSKPAVDHLGQEYKSIAAMAKAWGQTPISFRNRINRGWTLEKALTIPSDGRTRAFKNKSILGMDYDTGFTDHKGNEFKDFKSMCSYWGQHAGTVRKRINNGWSLEKALTHRRSYSDGIDDHLGNHFKSIREMGRKYGLTEQLIISRMKSGWPMQKILTTPAASSNRKQQ